MLKLENKIALITGSDSGMGQAMAEEFAKAGANVAVTFHTDEAGAEESRRRVQAAGRRAMVRQTDVRDEKASHACSRRYPANSAPPTSWSTMPAWAVAGQGAAK